MSLVVMEAKRTPVEEENWSWHDGKGKNKWIGMPFWGVMHGVSLTGALIGERRTGIIGLNNQLRL